MEFEEEYKNIKKSFNNLKYNLPQFEELEENFDLDKLIDRNPKFILQNIRRIMLEKFSSYSQLFEALLNPTSSSRLLHNILRKTNLEQKNKIKEYCDDLIKYQFDSIKLETIYDEKKEAEFLKESFTFWMNLKKDIMKLFNSIDLSLEDVKNTNQNNYFS